MQKEVVIFFKQVFGDAPDAEGDEECGEDVYGVVEVAKQDGAAKEQRGGQKDIA